ncbi:hypothetical protein GCM10011386_47110 [Parapedobacter defluvii]|uniref:Uncharacterized protein n=1 Tax=Parapedobacter defluvii TaxID=2045106 RepID=A0ABQ1MY94_9SPHI|nr:hypothetical protein [Parapedobacter defluvii]GGC49408.1 hypothetical protein GCM10011386_47110 [Parapedobacter defluvii]
MNTKNILSKAVFLLGILSLTACKFSASTGNPTADNLETVSKSDQKIRNGIQVEETGGAKVESAFLMLESGELVSDENTVKPDERFKLVLKISGWKAENGKVQVGAIEQVHDAARPIPLEGNDLFAGSDGLSEEDAQVIALNNGIPAASAVYEAYQTDFKVWNKSTEQYVRGSYRFKIK